MKFTQPVMIQIFKDEYELSEKMPVTPAEPGTVLVKTAVEEKVNQKRHTYFRSSVGKMLHMTR